MRVLLDQECAAVAGGHQSACERNVTIAAVATGALIGAAAGGAVGAVGGAGTGSLIAQIVAPPLCSWAEGEQEEEEPEPVEPELQDWHDNQYAAWNGKEHTSSNAYHGRGITA